MGDCPCAAALAFRAGVGIRWASMAGFFRKLIERFTRRKVDLDELEETLITGDVGFRMTERILGKLRDMGRSLDPEEVVDVCRREMLALLPEVNPPLPLFPDRPCVVLIVRGRRPAAAAFSTCSAIRRDGCTRRTT